MIITGIKASNFKVLKAIDVDIPEETGMIKIIGAGKSSFLEAIECAIGGAGGTPFEAIRHGEEECIITVKLSDEQYGKISVTKILKKDKKASLIVKSVNDNDVKTLFTSPQEVLDSFIGALSFDPLQFFSLKQEKQYNVLKDMLGLNKLDELDNRNKKDFEARTDINRDIKTKKALVEAIKVNNDIEIKQVDVNKLVSKLQKVNEKNNKVIFDNQANEQKIIRVEELYNRIKKLRKELEDTVNQHDMIVREIEGFKKEEFVDVNILKKDIKDAQEINDNYHKHQVKDQHIIDLQQLEDASTALTEKMEKRDLEKVKLMSKANIEGIIPGLNLDGGVIRYNNVALSECSTAERIKVSFAIGVASNYKLRTIFIKDGNSLDNKNMKLIKELAKEKDYNIMIELINDCPNEKGTMKIVIEAGEIQ